VKYFLTGLFFLMLQGRLNAQAWRIDLAYHYHYSQTWDKAIRTYNFSRPFLKALQPLLIHGINGSVCKWFGKTKNLQHGIQVSYAQIRSRARWDEGMNPIHLHMLQPGYLCHLSSLRARHNFFTEFGLSASGLLLSRKMNDISAASEDKSLRALGIGCHLSVSVGREIRLSEKMELVPFVRIGSIPWMHTPESEVVLNQTRGMIGGKMGTGIYGQIGIGLKSIRD
jgi:hypothetical protein